MATKNKKPKNVFWPIGHGRDLKIYFKGFFGVLYKVVRVPGRFTWGQISPSYPAAPFKETYRYETVIYEYPEVSGTCWYIALLCAGLD